MKYYDSIDNLPLWNWWQIQDTGDLGYLCEEYSEPEEDLKDVWYKIQDEYLQEFANKDRLRRIVKLKKELIEQQSKYVEEGDRHAKMMAQIAMADLEMETDVGTSPKSNTIIFLEEKLGRELDPKRVTVRKYNEYINYYSG